jgi:hypothetical protein
MGDLDMGLRISPLKILPYNDEVSWMSEQLAKYRVLFAPGKQRGCGGGGGSDSGGSEERGSRRDATRQRV